MRDVSVIGIGSTAFGLLEGQTLKSMATSACREAIKDAGIDKKQIQAFYVGNYISGMVLGQETLAPLIANSIGLNQEISCTKVEGACSSASIAMKQGYLMVAAGICDFVLVAGVEKMTTASIEKITQSLASSIDMETEGLTGLTFPGYWAMMWQRHMYEFGSTTEQLGLVSVKNRSNAVKNPRARFRDPVTIEKVTNSRLISDPLRLYDCCPVADGAAAAVLCAADMAEDYQKKPIDIVGIAQTTGHSTLYEQTKTACLPSTISAAKMAFKMAGLTPQDIDVVELHDCFTSAEIIDSEDLGFFEKGHGGIALQEGVTQIDGDIPINPSGGLLSKGHPVGATGLGQTYEIIKQLRGAHENQIKNARFGLTHNAGGTGAICCVQILKRR